MSYYPFDFPRLVDHHPQFYQYFCTILNFGIVSKIRFIRISKSIIRVVYRVDHSQKF